MQYLECIAMLCYLETKLQANRRVQVPVQVAEEAFSLIVQMTAKLKGKLPPGSIYEITVNDLLRALDAIPKMNGMTHMTETMKATIVEGISTMKEELCVYAYKYFTVNSIPDDICSTFEDAVQSESSPRNILRNVASVAISRGLYKQ